MYVFQDAFLRLPLIVLQSLIEANLVIITGCLPTMRLFFKHVAPNLIGESTLRSRSRKKSTGYTDGSQIHQSELQTISSKRTKKVYNRMDDDGISIGSEERAEAGWQGDQTSDKGILAPVAPGKIVKTETTVVSSEVMNGDRRTSASWKPGF